MSPSDTVKQEQFSTKVAMDHLAEEIHPTVDTGRFSNNVAMMEPSTSRVVVEIDTMTHSITTNVDTKALSIEVKHYLKSNQIKWGKFSTLVLGVSQSRLSSLLNNPEPFDRLTRRVQALYERMDLWMKTRATYGNNPYFKDKNVRAFNDKKQKKASVSKKPRSLLEGEENIEMLKALKDYNDAKNLLLIGSGELDLSEAGVTSAKHDHTGDSLQKVIEECVITMDTTDYENDEILTTRVANDTQEGVSIMVSQDKKNYDNDKMGRQGVNEGPLQVFMVEYPEGEELEMQVSQVFMEGTPEEPGTYRLSLQEPVHE